MGLIFGEPKVGDDRGALIVDTTCQCDTCRYFLTITWRDLIRTGEA